MELEFPQQQEGGSSVRVRGSPSDAVEGREQVKWMEGIVGDWKDRKG